MKKQLLFIISVLAMMTGCQEDSEFIPYRYTFDRFEFVGTIKALNYKGEYVGSTLISTIVLKLIH